MLLSPVQNTAYQVMGEWKPKRPRVTQLFGQDFVMNGKWVYQSLGMKGHNGIDYGLPVGTPIFASHDGIITHVKKDKGGYGWHVRIRSSAFARETIYAHLSRIDVKRGQWIAAGDKIGLSGNTGLSSGPHLHWGLRRLIKSAKPLERWQVQDYDNGFFGWVDPFNLYDFEKMDFKYDFIKKTSSAPKIVARLMGDDSAVGYTITWKGTSLNYNL